MYIVICIYIYRCTYIIYCILVRGKGNCGHCKGGEGAQRLPLSGPHNPPPPLFDLP